MPTSQNGFRANDRRVITTFEIPGTTRKVSLREGAPGGLLAHWAAWFHEHVESIDTGQLDDWGYAERTIRGSSTTLSNHASGTAIDLNATRHPLGKVGTFTPGQAKRIRAELAKYEGAIRWGGDYHGRKDEMHFEIMASPARCAQVLDKLTAPTAKKRPPAHTPVIDGRAQVKEGMDLIDSGLGRMGEAPETRKVVHTRIALMQKQNAATRATWRKGPSK